MPVPNIVYKALGFRWINQAFCPASAFVSADKNEARNPQRFIHATVRAHAKKDTGHIDNDEYLQTYHISDRLYDRTDST